MFNQRDQYYRAYANNPTNAVTSVSGLLGNPGGPQAWDFSNGPQEVTYRFDYLLASNTTHGASFVAMGAQIAEQKTDEANTNSPSWLYFTQDPLKGRLVAGFYDPAFSSLQPEAVFTNALQDFPATIHYGDTWQGTTVFESLYNDPLLGDEGFPDQLTYTSTDRVDAYGIITLPNFGFLDCLRVHELVQYDIAFDLGDGYQKVASQYVLNYYWLAPGHGIVAQITSTSPSDGSQPPDDLPGGAATVVRMFETNHSESGTNAPATINGFKITLGKTAALLQWTAQVGIGSYRVDYATALGNTATWQTLGSTTANFMLDPAAVTPASRARYYRVVGN